MRGAALAALPLLAACMAQPAPGGCPAGLAPGMVAEAFLGRDRAGAPEVSEAELAAFLAEEATPRFPDGLTVLDAAGQWRGADGGVLRERSRLLVIALPGADAAQAAARLAPLAEAYRTRFRQEAVLRVVRPACLGF
ncbi:DUF3574 domain-containing protein [Roseomonas sp. OT10]|uniref:DUF3574 domain-containing protein n=1 Tax=Roseomonas cutis TaxID=2897332 RepID=UPI001E40D587|nr:DUF3574 domain-containing protein [Roseomonas sp. OT10]UFN51289.1 DUF3574 domain-containing protein [Roseomonas sp. OT10]